MSDSEKRFKIVKDDNMSDSEEYYYSDDNFSENSKSDESLNAMCFSDDTSDKNNGESKNSCEYYSNDEINSNDDSINDDIPEYRKITKDNMYAFISWANERREPSISFDHFNIIIQSKMDEWLHKNNITWQYALTIITDIIKTQSNISSNFDISSNDIDEIVKNQIKNVDNEVVNNKLLDNKLVDNKIVNNVVNLKPTDIYERRKLFAAAAEKRATRRF